MRFQERKAARPYHLAGPDFRPQDRPVKQLVFEVCAATLIKGALQALCVGISLLKLGDV